VSASDEQVRLFVALELPDGVVSGLVRWREDIVTAETGLRAVPPWSLHVTLCFLGSQPAAAVPDINAACGVVASLPAAELTVEGAVWLPPRRPRVLAVELGDADGRLEDVQVALSDALHTGGWYMPEPGPFLAHVTVARVRNRTRVRPRELSPPGSEPRAFAGSRVTLFRSRLSSAGARYEPLGSVQLGGGATKTHESAP
jgi:RNA 2',3'-cyclic 3'-phosphodiesterase